MSPTSERRAAAGLLLLAAALPGPALAQGPSAPFTPYCVAARRPHDPAAFTQGLLLHAGRLYESTGLRGRSSLREVDPASGRVLRRVELPRERFGEGLARVGERLFQLSWTSGEATVYRLADLAPVARHRYRGEGWGLAFDGRRLIMSDGSATLRFRDPADFRVTGQVEVLDGGAPVRRLNELEYAHGRLYANVWRTAFIAVVDPTDGAVTGWLDLRPLAAAAGAGRGADVANGIAHDPRTGRLLVTGKLWPVLFELELGRVC